MFLHFGELPVPVICSKIMDCGNICQNHYNKFIPRKHKFITPRASRYCLYLDEKGNYICAVMNFDNYFGVAEESMGFSRESLLERGGT